MLTLLLALILTCPLTGDAKTAKLREMDRAKNHGKPAAGEVAAQRLLENFFEHGDDTKRWTPQLVWLDGWVVRVKRGGPETCNCHAKQASRWDRHIVLALKSGDGPEKGMVCEITPRLPIAPPAVGSYIRVTGYLLFDFPHAAQATNTNPTGKRNWRATAWEVHPVTAWKVVAPHGPGYQVVR